MDDRFPDLMNELSDLDPTILQTRWDTVCDLASNAEAPRRARLVLLATRDLLDRESDSWFWKPFREHEPSFPIDKGVELHSRLALACLREQIAVDPLAAMLVVLALETEREFVSAGFGDEARRNLAPAIVAVGGFGAPRGIWTSTKSKDVTSGQLDLAEAVNGLGKASSAALRKVGLQISTLTKWAIDAESRFSSESAILQWLVAGVRADGQSWTKLPQHCVAVDAGLELASMLIGAPLPRQDAVLAQLLAVSGAEPGLADVDGLEKVRSDLPRLPNSAPRALFPLLAGLSGTDKLPPIAAFDLARRVMWEAATLRAWDEAE